MSLSLITCSSLGSVAQLIFWAFFFVALSLIKNNDFKGHLHGWSGVIYITFPFQETNTDFNQCCWWFYTVSTRVPLALTHFCNHTDTPTQLIWTQASKLEMILWGTYTSAQSLWENREPLDPSAVLLVLVKVHWDSFTFVALPMISESSAGFHKVWVLSSLQQLLCLMGWSCCSDHWLLGCSSSDMKSHFSSCSASETYFLFSFLWGTIAY